MKLLAWFQQSHTMYNIKEVETIASKKTGISSMQIKDILKLLVDEGLVNCEKCGISNIYWSFQYTSIIKMTKEYDRLLVRKTGVLNSIDQHKVEIKQLTAERTGLSKKERTTMIDKASKLQSEKTALEAQLDSLLANTPEKVNARLENIKKLQEAIDVLMDNIDLLVNFIADSNPAGMTKASIREYFGVPEED